MASLVTSLLFLSLVAPSFQHIVITYPGWRGDNLATNGTPPAENPNSIGIDYVNNTPTFPYGMQWMYPCGGMPLTTNRTKWPVGGGAVAFQPGWFPGHASALLYINIGLQQGGDLNPPNMSHPIMPPIQLVGPNNTFYGGEVCFPQLPMPPNLSLKIGDNITIQVIEIAQHGAALYSCVDVTLADPSDVEKVTYDNCRNDTWMTFNQLFTTANLTSSATSLSFAVRPSLVSLLSTAVLVSIFAGTFGM